MALSKTDSRIYNEYRAVVLAGGESRRMGVEKSGVKLGGRSLLSWVEQVLSTMGLDWSVLRVDLAPGLGPLGGVKTAFAENNRKPIVFLSCDMPFIDAAILEGLITASRTARLPAFSFVSDRVGFPSLLLPEQAACVSERLNAGRRSLSGLAQSIPSVLVRPAEKDVWRFHNINAPEDLEIAKAYLDRDDDRD